MKHKLLLLALLGLFGAHSGASAAVIFSDDFSGGGGNWNNERGNWRVVDGRYDATNPNNQPPTFSTAKTAALTDFIVELDVLGANDGGIWLRADYNGGNVNGVLLVTGGNGGNYDGLYWHVLSNGSYGSAMSWSPYTGLQGADLDLRVEVQGDTYKAFLGGTLVSTLTDATYASGLVGLYDFSPVTGASDPRGQAFDNVVIRTFDADPPGVPEPSTLALLGIALSGLALLGHRRPAATRFSSTQ